MARPETAIPSTLEPGWHKTGKLWKQRKCSPMIQHIYYPGKKLHKWKWNIHTLMFQEKAQQIHHDSSWAKLFYINPSTGVRSSTCITVGGISVPCWGKLMLTGFCRAFHNKLVIYLMGVYPTCSISYPFPFPHTESKWHKILFQFMTVKSIRNITSTKQMSNYYGMHAVGLSSKTFVFSFICKHEIFMSLTASNFYRTLLNRCSNHYLWISPKRKVILFGPSFILFRKI